MPIQPAGAPRLATSPPPSDRQARRRSPGAVPVGPATVNVEAAVAFTLVADASRAMPPAAAMGRADPSCQPNTIARPATGSATKRRAGIEAREGLTGDRRVDVAVGTCSLLRGQSGPPAEAKAYPSGISAAARAMQCRNECHLEGSNDDRAGRAPGDHRGGIVRAADDRLSDWPLRRLPAVGGGQSSRPSD